jgi:hypothetical protein
MIDGYEREIRYIDKFALGPKRGETGRCSRYTAPKMSLFAITIPDAYARFHRRDRTHGNHNACRG